MIEKHVCGAAIQDKCLKFLEGPLQFTLSIGLSVMLWQANISIRGDIWLFCKFYLLKCYGQTCFSSIA